ncbi:hypothetical protein QOZ80_6AG0533800 [Eleusine coracana subsp. coracana]|nr:hypothetical protein QOZ80_6AG0533800 [Eleusine coracana subsp. coracana]
MAAARYSPCCSFLALLLLPLVVLSAAAASYETKSIDPGLVVMTLPQPVSGPESLAFDGRGRGPYSGVSDGRILRWHGGRQGWAEFAYNHKHKSLALCAPEKKLVVPEDVCGRPLGLQFHRKSGDLYVADAYLGLLRVPARGGLAEVVAAEAGGVPFYFLNGLDVDQRTGDVYFTDSSTTYRRSDHILVVALGDATGRLLRYNRRARRVAVLHSDLPYPNGVAVGADGAHVVVAHTGLSELRRYWVRGPRAGRSETFNCRATRTTCAPTGGAGTGWRWPRGSAWAAANPRHPWSRSGCPAMARWSRRWTGSASCP